MSDDVVQTRDGKWHRVLWPCKQGTHLHVKACVGRSRDAYKIKLSDVVVRHTKAVR